MPTHAASAGPASTDGVLGRRDTEPPTARELEIARQRLELHDRPVAGPMSNVCAFCYRPWECAARKWATAILRGAGGREDSDA